MPLPNDNRLHNSRLHLHLSCPATPPPASTSPDCPPLPTSPSTAASATPASIATNASPRAPDPAPSPTSSASSLFSAALSLSSASTGQTPATDPTSTTVRRLPESSGSDGDEVGTLEATGGTADSASAPGAIASPFGGRAPGRNQASGDRRFLAGTKRHTDDRTPSNPALPTAAGFDVSVSNPRAASWKRPRLVSSVNASLAWESDPDANFDAVPGLADMLGRTRNEHESIETQCLHRGEVLPDVSAKPTAAAAAPADTAAGPAVHPSPPLLSSDDYDLLAELLDQDDRLVFVVDANATAKPQQDPLQIPILFANSALRALPRIFNVVSGFTTHATKASIGDFSQFKAWALSETREDTSVSVVFAGVQWTASALRQRYRVLRGSHVASTPAAASPLPAEAQVSPCQPEPEALPTPAEQHPPSDTSTADATEATAVEYEDLGPTSMKTPTEEDKTTASFDWTRIAITDDVPDHIKFARSINWGATPLGPIEQWPGDLRGMTNLVMGSPHPAALYCGPDFTTIYNEAFTSVLGRRHPSLMGSSFEDSWPEIWETVEPSFRNAWTAGQAVFKRDHCVFIDRGDFQEEAYFNYSLVPLVGVDGSVIAIYNQMVDNTRRKINERRMLTLHEMGEKTAVAKTAHALWRAVCSGFESNEYDMPFFLLYSAEGHDDTASEKGDTGTPPRVVLEASLGVPQGHPAAARALDLSTSNEGFAPYMRDALSVAAARQQNGSSPVSDAVRTSPPVVLSADDGTLPTALMAGLQGERGFDHPCHTVVVFPIQHPTASGEAACMTVSGFVVLGINPHRPFDHDYRMFVHLLARHLTTSLATVTLFEEEVRRSQRMALKAAQDRQELARQLQLRTQQVVESESKFRLMAEFTPVGIFMTDGAGHITYNNDMWTKISRYPGERTPPSGSWQKHTESNASEAEADQTSSWLTWMETVMEEDRPGLAAAWDRIVHGKAVVTHEFRFKQRTTIQTEDGSGPPIDTTTWVLLRAYPDKDENGNLKRMFGCITDISKQKLAEDFQSRLRQEAVEHRRQQENFIDVTSHELRNPLSAILQSVDEINNTVAEFRDKTRGSSTSIDAAVSAPDVGALLDSVLEASSTISLCANHQKRMVEDVIILSKVDSHLLLVTPIEVQPVMVVRQTLKIVESELLAHDIRCTFRVEPSYQSLVGINSWVKLDPSRLNQVLINLISNAIKFTQKCEERSIVVYLGASEEQDEQGQEQQQHTPSDRNIFSSFSDIVYVPRRQDTSGVADGPDWGDGHKLNLHIAVSDTGLGLKDEDKDVLLQHFSQASPRTHVQYGGGLGLFISRSLTELQGGQIGVRPHNGRGGTFAFYIKCRAVPSTPVGVTPGTSNLSVAIPELTFARRGSGSVVAFESGGSTSSSTGGRHDDSRDSGNNDRNSTPKPTVIAKLPPTPVMLLSPTSEDPHAGFITVPTNAKSVAMEAVCAGSTTSAASRVANNNNSNRSGSSNGNASSIGNGVSNTASGFNVPDLAVLIVEDNLVNQRVLQRQLDRSGSRTFVANHGGEALDVLRQSTFWRPTDDEDAATAAAIAAAIKDNGTMGEEARLSTATDAVIAAAVATKKPQREPRVKISVVLMDLEMPVMDGMTCARAIRALERSGTLVRHVPIIAVTAYVRQEQIESAKAAGVDDVISKPFRLAQLLPKIQELVAQYDGAGAAAATAAAAA